jgi:hypothetical protein
MSTSFAEALEALRLLDASGDKVRAFATLANGRVVELFEGPVPAADAIVGIKAIESLPVERVSVHRWEA